jgi:hypothetical protein
MKTAFVINKTTPASVLLSYKFIQSFPPLVGVIPKTAIAAAFIIRGILCIPLWTTFGEEIDPNKCASLASFCAVLTVSAFPKIVLSSQKLKFRVQIFF